MAIDACGFIAKRQGTAGGFQACLFAGNSSIKGSIKMSAEYRKILAPQYKCSICGKLNCKYYGSSKSEKKIFKRLVRNKLKVSMFKELKGE